MRPYVRAWPCGATKVAGGGLSAASEDTAIQDTAIRTQRIVHRFIHISTTQIALDFPNVPAEPTRDMVGVFLAREEVYSACLENNCAVLIICKKKCGRFFLKNILLCQKSRNAVFAYVKKLFTAKKNPFSRAGLTPFPPPVGTQYSYRSTTFDGKPQTV